MSEENLILTHASLTRRVTISLELSRERTFETNASRRSRDGPPASAEKRTPHQRPVSWEPGESAARGFPATSPYRKAHRIRPNPGTRRPRSRSREPILVHRRTIPRGRNDGDSEHRSRCNPTGWMLGVPSSKSLRRIGVGGVAWAKLSLRQPRNAAARRLPSSIPPRKTLSCEYRQQFVITTGNYARSSFKMGFLRFSGTATEVPKMIEIRSNRTQVDVRDDGCEPSMDHSPGESGMITHAYLETRRTIGPFVEAT